MEKKFTKGPLECRRYTQTDAEIEEVRGFGLRPTSSLNDKGAIPILAAGGVVVGWASCLVEFKRGEGSKTECEERDANGRLWAAAPCLFDSLGEMTDLVERLSDKSGGYIVQIAKARAALKKALEGE